MSCCCRRLRTQSRRLSLRCARSRAPFRRSRTQWMPWPRTLPRSSARPRHSPGCRPRSPRARPTSSSPARTTRLSRPRLLPPLPTGTDPQRYAIPTQVQLAGKCGSFCDGSAQWVPPAYLSTVSACDSCLKHRPSMQLPQLPQPAPLPQAPQPSAPAPAPASALSSLSARCALALSVKLHSRDFLSWLQIYQNCLAKYDIRTAATVRNGRNFVAFIGQLDATQRTSCSCQPRPDIEYIMLLAS